MYLFAFQFVNRRLQQNCVLVDSVVTHLVLHARRLGSACGGLFTVRVALGLLNSRTFTFSLRSLIGTLTHLADGNLSNRRRRMRASLRVRVSPPNRGLLLLSRVTKKELQELKLSFL